MKSCKVLIVTLAMGMFMLAGCRGCGCGSDEQEPETTKVKKADKPAPSQPDKKEAKPTRTLTRAADETVPDHKGGQRRAIRPVHIPMTDPMDASDPRLPAKLHPISKKTLKGLEKLQASDPRFMPKPDSMKNLDPVDEIPLRKKRR